MYMHVHTTNVIMFLLAFVVQSTMFVCGTQVGECVSYLQANLSTVMFISTKSFSQYKFTLLLLT